MDIRNLNRVRILPAQPMIKYIESGAEKNLNEYFRKLNNEK
jgi:hypothetical protein